MHHERIERNDEYLYNSDISMVLVVDDFFDNDEMAWSLVDQVMWLDYVQVEAYDIY